MRALPAVLLAAAAAAHAQSASPRSSVLHLRTEGLARVEATSYCTFPVSAAEAEAACGVLGLQPAGSRSLQGTFACRGTMEAVGLLERRVSMPVGRLLEGTFAQPLDTLRVSLELPRTPRTACTGLSPIPSHFSFFTSASYEESIVSGDASVELRVGYPTSALVQIPFPFLFLAPIVLLPILGIARSFPRDRALRHLGELWPWFPWYLRLALPLCFSLWLAAAGLLEIDLLLSLLAGGGPHDALGLRVLLLAGAPLVATVLASIVADSAISGRLGSPLPVRSIVAAFTIPITVALPFLAFVFLPLSSAWPALGLGLLGALALTTIWVGGVDLRKYAAKEGAVGLSAEAIAADHGLRALDPFVVPAADALRLRAAVGQSRRFVIADTLAARLLPEELEALLLLEMVRRQRATRRSLVVFLAATPLLTCVPPILGLVNLALDLALRGLLAWLVGVATSRYLTARELREAASLLGDPAPLARALVALMAADGWSATWYPWDRRLFRLPTLARQAASLAGEPLPLPAPLAPPPPAAERILGPVFRQRALLRALGRHLLLAIAPPLAAAWLVEPGRAGSSHPTALLVSGAAAAPLLMTVLGGLLPVAGFRRAMRRLRDALRRDGLDAPDAAPVGISGGAWLRTHDGFYELDYGVLHVTPDRVAFAGELHRFLLHRDEVVALRLEPGAAAVLPRSRIHVEWCGRNGASGTLHVRGQRPLEARLLAWQRGAAEGGDLPEALAALGPPELPHDSGELPAAPRRLLTSLIVVAAVAAISALAAGLPGRSAAYVATVTAAAFAAAMLPALRHARAEARREWGLP